MSLNWSEEDVKRHNERVKNGKKGKAADKTQTSTQKMQALGRLKDGEMNKTEAAYEQYLSHRKLAGEVLWYKFESVKLRLANKTFYTCDFFVMLANGQLEAHEVKGFWQEDARIKTKVAAEQFPFQFVGVQRDGDGWKFEKF